MNTVILSTLDWIQAISSVIAAIGLIVTLKLQWQTSEDQRIMLQHAQDEERISLMPIFKATNANGGNVVTLLLFRLQVEDMTAYNVTFRQVPGAPFETDAPLYPGDFHQGRSVTYSLVRLAVVEAPAHIFTITYSDKKRRYYQQRFLTDGFDMQIELPTRTQQPTT